MAHTIAENGDMSPVRATFVENSREHLRFVHRKLRMTPAPNPHHARRWADPRAARHRPADGRARRDDREHRAALRPGRARLLRREPPVGRHRLRPRRSAACCCSAAASATSSAASASSSPACSASPSPPRSAAPPQSFGVLVAARALQGAFGALLAPAALSLLTTTFTDPEGARQGVRHLRRDRRRRRRHRPAARRRPHRVPHLALVPLRQPAVRRSRPPSPRFVAAASTRSRPSARGSTSPARVTATTGLFALVYGFSHAETTAGATPLTIACSSPSAVLLVAFVADPARVQPPAAAAARRARPQPRRRLPGDGHRRRGHVRRLPVPDLLPADDARLLADPDRPRVPADVAGDHRSPRRRRPPGCVPRIGPKPLVAAGMALAAVAMAFFAQLDVDSTYALHILPGLLLIGIGLGLVFAPALSDRDARRRAGGRRRRLGDGQHHPAGRRLDRHRAAEHARRQRRDQLHRRQRRQPRRRRGRRRPRLHDRVLVVGRDLRRRRRRVRDRRCAPARWRPPRRPWAPSRSWLTSAASWDSEARSGHAGPSPSCP